MSEPKGTSNEDIGRPGPWTETRYQQPGKPVDKTVDEDTKDPASQPVDDVSTPVTREDYTGKKP